MKSETLAEQDMFKRLFCLVVAATLLLPLGCDKGGAGSGGRKTIGVVPKGLTHIFWRSVKAGAEKAGKEENVDIKWDGPPKEGEVNTQIRIIGDLRNRGVDALVVAPLSKTAISEYLADAKKKMPVVVFDSGSDFKDYDAFVATDNFRGGQLAGQAMLKLIGAQKGVELAMVKYGSESESTLQREAGFLSEIKKNDEIKVYEQFAGDTADKAQTLMGNMLAAHPGINAVFSSNESTTVGALGALEQAKKLGKIKFVGFDSSAELVAALDKGDIQALVLQDPVKMGYLSVKAAAAALRGEKPAKEQPIAPTLVTQENKDQPEIQQLLRPKVD
jgi:ribose transport system substrate-binding protein